LLVVRICVGRRHVSYDVSLYVRSLSAVSDDVPPAIESWPNDGRHAEAAPAVIGAGDVGE